MFTLVLSSLIACGLDRHAIRLEAQEKALLYQNAQRHWEGMRWGVPARAAAFYEDPLTRARLESDLESPYSRIVDVKVLHVELDPKIDKEKQKTDKTVRKGTVYVRIEGFGTDNVLRVEENRQRWYRNTNGWWIEYPPSK
ncbi:MAG: hypothetical protein VX278_11805 [Myxococcota bacterium]|nr:hypothetical protein [Myxococcota bacterium]